MDTVAELLNDLDGMPFEDQVDWLDMTFDIASLRTLGPGDPGYVGWVERSGKNRRSS